MLKLLIADLKMTVRNKQALFWSLMFPLIFTVIFGFFFGKGSSTTGTIAFINKSDSHLAREIEKSLEQSELFKVKNESSIQTAKSEMKKNKVMAIVEIPKDFASQMPGSPTQLKVYIDPGNAQGNSIITGYLNAFLTQANFKAQHAYPIFSIKEEKTSSSQFSYFDFVLVGLLGMALMNSSIQGIAISMSKYREDKILKRLTTTPMKGWHFIGAEVISRLVLNIAQIALILLVGVYGFGAHINGNIPLIFLLAALGGILFQMIGFTIASLSRTTQAAEGMATAITIPMMFLAGIFFPIDQLPKWLYSFVQYLPLAPVLRMIRGVALDSTSPLENPANIAIVLCWIIAAFGLSIYKFRLTEE
jgi:ABC-2 type transport system permease protein